MKILITGSTANQTNPVTHQRCTNFAGLMKDALESVGAEVVWQRPSIVPQSFDQYDKVIVGLSSPFSLTANHFYGAMTCAASLWKDSKLAFYIDSADPNNITRGLEVVAEKPDTLFKEFFERRKDYPDVDRELLIDLCGKLLTETWPATLAPSLPWVSDDQIGDALPEVAKNSLLLMGLDGFIFQRFGDRPNREYPYSNNIWMVDRRHDSRWLKSLSLSLPVDTLEANHRKNVHSENLAKLQVATGYLHSPYRLDRTWWTPYIAMALSQGTAVFTNWRYSKRLGDEWNVLPGTFETFSASEQNAVALGQYEAYLASTPTASAAAKTLTKALEL